MKILKNNYYTEETNIKEETNSYPKELICENCDSELEYEKSDIKIGSFGCAYVDCPCCGYDNFLDDGENDIVLTINNIEFPAHFWHTSKETGAVDRCTPEEVKKEIKRIIEYLRNHRDEYHYNTECGNLNVIVDKYYGDEAYHITVTNDFYTTEIPFEAEDY